MTYRGHSLLRCLSRAHFSPLETTGQVNVCISSFFLQTIVFIRIFLTLILALHLHRKRQRLHLQYVYKNVCQCDILSMVLLSFSLCVCVVYDLHTGDIEQIISGHVSF